MSSEQEKKTRKAQVTRKKNVAEREKMIKDGASVKAELKALKKLIKDGWVPPNK